MGGEAPRLDGAELAGGCRGGGVPAADCVGGGVTGAVAFATNRLSMSATTCATCLLQQASKPSLLLSLEPSHSDSE